MAWSKRFQATKWITLLSFFVIYHFICASDIIETEQYAAGEGKEEEEKEEEENALRDLKTYCVA